MHTFLVGGSALYMVIYVLLFNLFPSWLLYHLYISFFLALHGHSGLRWSTFILLGQSLSQTVSSASSSVGIHVLNSPSHQCHSGFYCYEVLQLL